MKTNPIVAQEVRSQWSAWLKRALATAGVSAKDLGGALALDKGRRTKEQSGAYARLLADWAASAKTVSAPLAFETGEALRAQGASFLSGPAALYGASYVADAIGVCAIIANASDDAAAAVVSILYAAPRVFDDDADPTLLQALDRRLGPREIDAYLNAAKERAKLARDICARMNKAHGHVYGEAWDAWMKESQKKAPRLAEPFAHAYNVAKVRTTPGMSRAIEAILESWAHPHADPATRRMFSIRSEDEHRVDPFIRHAR